MKHYAFCANMNSFLTLLDNDCMDFFGGAPLYYCPLPFFLTILTALQGATIKVWSTIATFHI